MKTKSLIVVFGFFLLFLSGCVASAGPDYGYYPPPQPYYAPVRPYYYPPRPVVVVPAPGYRPSYRPRYDGYRHGNSSSYRQQGTYNHSYGQGGHGRRH